MPQSELVDKAEPTAKGPGLRGKLMLLLLVKTVTKQSVPMPDA
jgi:hypothetical protein